MNKQIEDDYGKLMNIPCPKQECLLAPWILFLAISREPIFSVVYDFFPLSPIKKSKHVFTDLEVSLE